MRNHVFLSLFCRPVLLSGGAVIAYISLLFLIGYMIGLVCERQSHWLFAYFGYAYRWP
jgi:hypothetical protein